VHIRFFVSLRSSLYDGKSLGSTILNETTTWEGHLGKGTSSLTGDKVKEVTETRVLQEASNKSSKT